MVLCLTSVLPALLLAPCAHAEAGALQRPAMIAAAAGNSPDQVRINQLKQELKTVQQLLKQKNHPADQQAYEKRRKSLQAELDDLAPKKKTPDTAKKSQINKGHE